MLSPEQKLFLRLTAAAATKSGHIFPEFAACEAALESTYGKSLIAREGNNLFGTKQHTHPIYGNLSLPTREFLHGGWTVVNAEWVKYPDTASCFADRMATLKRLSSVYPHYKAALEAGSGVTYVYEVSKTWSTDPNRANKVLDVYDEMAGDWNATA
jgi:flagellum-specific peptidoglycan hydrolase FlgJ